MLYCICHYHTDWKINSGTQLDSHWVGHFMIVVTWSLFHFLMNRIFLLLPMRGLSFLGDVSRKLLALCNWSSSPKLGLRVLITIHCLSPGIHKRRKKLSKEESLKNRISICCFLEKSRFLPNVVESISHVIYDFCRAFPWIIFNINDSKNITTDRLITVWLLHIVILIPYI